MLKKQVQEKQEALFAKEQLLKSKKYTDKKDLLNVLLEEGKTYTAKAVDDLIDSFLKKEVK